MDANLSGLITIIAVVVVVIILVGIAFGFACYFWQCRHGSSLGGVRRRRGLRTERPPQPAGLRRFGTRPRREGGAFRGGGPGVGGSRGGFTNAAMEPESVSSLMVTPVLTPPPYDAVRRIEAGGGGGSERLSGYGAGVFVVPATTAQWRDDEAPPPYDSLSRFPDSAFEEISPPPYKL